MNNRDFGIMSTKLLLSLALRLLLLDLGMAILFPRNPCLLLLGQGVRRWACTGKVPASPAFGAALHRAIVPSVSRGLASVARAPRSLLGIDIVAVGCHMLEATAVATHPVVVQSICTP